MLRLQIHLQILVLFFNFLKNKRIYIKSFIKRDKSLKDLSFFVFFLKNGIPFLICNYFFLFKGGK